MRLLGLGLSALATAQFSPDCPYFTEEDWVLVRRAKDNAHAAADHLVGTSVYGTTSTDIFDRSVKAGNFHAAINDATSANQGQQVATKSDGEPVEFSVKWSDWTYTTFMFASGDCNLWMKMSRDEVIQAGTNTPVSHSSLRMTWIVLESHMKNYPYGVLQYNKMHYDGDPAVAFTNNHPYTPEGDPIDCNAIYMGDNYENVGSSSCGAHEGNKYGDRYNGLSVFIKNRECTGPYQHGYTGWREVCWYADNTTPGPVSWQQASDACAANGGQLAVPKNQDEMQFIYDRTLFSSGTRSWLGISDLDLDGNWINHYTGEQISWDNFITTDNANGDEYYAAFLQSGFAQDWFDYSNLDGASGGFVCFEGDTCDKALCQAWGDPHVRTFDGNTNDIYEQGTYTLAEATGPSLANGAEYFHVKLETKMDTNGGDWSYADAVSVDFQSYDGLQAYQIRLESSGAPTYALNGGNHTAFSTSGNRDFELRIEDGRLNLYTWFGLRIMMNGRYAEVEVPPRYRNGVQGVCGNFDCAKEDDWTEKDGTTCTLANGDDAWECQYNNQCSFLDASAPDNIVTCGSGLPPLPPTCTDGTLLNQCQQLFDDAEFDACQYLVDIQGFIDACQVDICRVDDPDRYRCDILEMFMAECEFMKEEERTDLTFDLCNYNCPISRNCPANMEWNNCATCEDKYTCQEKIDNYNCNDGYYTVQNGLGVGSCVCIAGYYLQDGVCVPLGDCNPTPPAWAEWGEWTDCTGTCFPGGTQTRVRLCLGPGACDEAIWPGIGQTMELAMCNMLVLCTTTTDAPTTTVATVVPVVGVDMSDGTCWSGNWTKFFSIDDPSDGLDIENFVDHVAGGTVECPMISAVEAKVVGGGASSENFTIDAQVGFTCEDSIQADGSCEDYEVRFCCEGCCPYLNVSGDPQLTDYYENYPGIYELTEEIFNDQIVYRQIAGYDGAGEVIYGEGVIYYWGDVGWLIGANTFTYSYYSDGIGEICPQFAPSNWTNEVYGTQLTVLCLPVYPSCNDVECTENACCVMREDGPVCECLPGFELYEDGSCLAPTTAVNVTDGDGDCSTPGHVWSDWLNADDADNFGDWEALRSHPQVCTHPVGIEAQRVDQSNTDLQVVHISKEYGFWCIHTEQDGGVQCTDWEVRFCCPKYETGNCDTASGDYGWTAYASHDSPGVGIGDFETITYLGERDVCSSPTGVRAQQVNGTTGEDDVTHIDASRGFWCVNEEQPNGECADFEVSFCCPIPKADAQNVTYIMDGTCDDSAYGWTPFMNTSSPDGSGDYETRANFARLNVCENPTAIQARTYGPGATENVHINVNNGFWCVNDENSEQCADWDVRFCCPMYKTGDCTAEQGQWTGWYNDEWNKKNERIWVSAREERETLLTYGDGAACADPSQAEIRPRPTGSTSFQTTMWEYSTHLVDTLTTTEYSCINEDQVDGYKCIDMEIRFCCPDKLQVGECDQEGYAWTDYTNEDLPDNDGDYETKFAVTSTGVCDSPIAVQANNVDGGSQDQTHIDLTLGFYCLNSEQTNGQCADFEVRYCCPKYQVGECNKKGYEWTAWLDRDDPVGQGDWENLDAFEPGQACASPIAAKASDLSGKGFSDQITHLSLSGFKCFNDEQTNGHQCGDFAVSFCCPIDEVVTCENANCGENEFCLETSSGPTCPCGDDDFNIDWDEIDYTRYEDGTCIPNDPTTTTNATTGETTIEIGSCNTFGYEWTPKLNMGDPLTADGDYEYMHNYNKQTVCSSPSGIRATTTGASGIWPLHMNLELGFWCVNSEQADGGQCADFEVEYCCPSHATGDCDNSTGMYEWSDWFNNDQPDGMGDWEARTHLMCAHPTAVKAQTANGAPFNAITHIDTNLGFWCLNEENGGVCEDYQVSYCCPTLAEGECSTYGHAWQAYSDLDDPEGDGDLETIIKQSANDVCDEPTGIKARLVNQTETQSDAFTRISITEGFVCLNDIFNTCNDFEVSYCCPKWGAGDTHCSIKGHEWTPWINNDSPAAGTGDWETRPSFVESGVCSSPTGIQAAPTDGGSTQVTHIDESLGFWCINEEQQTGPCADFEVRYCCPQFEIGSDPDCSDPDYEWTEFLDRDDPTEDGDFESIADYPLGSVCSSPTGIQAQTRTSGSTAHTHIDVEYGFYCANDEQPNGEGCADFEVRYCCPKKEERLCDADGYEWTIWLDRDDPTDSGDYENREGHGANVVCQNPLGIQAQKRFDSAGSDAVVHFDNTLGFWCINDEQPKDETCADFEVRFCCPEEYHNPCAYANLTCTDNTHGVFEVVDNLDGTFTEQCSCKCDEGFYLDGSNACVKDDRCEATLTNCKDFDTCINTKGYLNPVTDATCDTAVGSSSCTDGGTRDGSDGSGIKIECSDPDAFPSNNGGTDGYIYCTCDGKNPCEWKSEDFLGDLTEDDMCITDSNCPVTPWLTYDGQLQLSREKFLNDPKFNTLQSDLYDNDQAEVLGRIQTNNLPQFTSFDWTEGHFLVIVWQTEMLNTLAITPYGDYYDMIETDFGDGDVQVWETFTDNLILRDASGRDLTQNMDVVLDIRHNYDLDIEDINELLNFRIAMIPKSWVDQYGDTIRKNGQEIAECLNQLLTNNARVDPTLKRRSNVFKKLNKKTTKKPYKGWKKNKNKKTWKQRKQGKMSRSSRQ